MISPLEITLPIMLMIPPLDQADAAWECGIANNRLEQYIERQDITEDFPIYFFYTFEQCATAGYYR